MRGIEGEQVLLRIILSESSMHGHRPLSAACWTFCERKGLRVRPS